MPDTPKKTRKKKISKPAPVLRVIDDKKWKNNFKKSAKHK
jgi:hypothetical protein